jgi:hypothetical protein
MDLCLFLDISDIISVLDLKEHHCIVHKVLKCLHDSDLYLHPEKCNFEKTKVEYLGMVILEGQVRMDPAKVAVVKTWAQPKNLRNVCVFIGFANFYQQFIKDFSTIMWPLHDLTTKDAPWWWMWVEKKAFQMLKDVFISKPILAMWDPVSCSKTACMLDNVCRSDQVRIWHEGL